MVSKTESAVWIIYPVCALLLSIAGCSGGEYVRHVDRSVTTYLDHGDSGSRSYKDNSESTVTRYIKKGGQLIRITPERGEVVAGAPMEVLEPIDAELKDAVSVAELDQYIAKYAPAPQAFVALQRIAKGDIDNKNWEAAAGVFKKYRELFPGNSRDINDIITILEAPEDGVRVSNLGLGVNSAEGEYSPVLSSDGKKLYFARDCGVCNGGEEIYVATRTSDGRWGMAGRFGAPLSTKGHEVPLGVSSDGNRLAIYGNYPGAMGRGDIYFIQKTADGWSEVEQYPAPVNTEHFESNAMYTADGKAMLFISERPGGIGEFHKKNSFYHGGYSGNTDIYVQVMNHDGTSEIVNLGPTINTPYSEYSPFLHPDGKTLYFSSDGHPGIGGLDVFKSTRLNDHSWTEWSAPVNLGKEINTTGNDWGYQVSTPGDLAYFAISGRNDGLGGSDIYAIGMPVKVQPTSVITVSGTVTDPDGDGLEADIRWSNLETQEEIGYASSDPLNGEYVIHLPSGGHYGYYAEKDGYIGESENYNLKDDFVYKEYILDIVLYPVPKPVVAEPEPAEAVEMPELSDQPVGEFVPVPIRMNNIFFEFNKADLHQESNMELDRWVRFLNDNQMVKLEIYGHTDNVGSDNFNLKLSERRARAVAGYLVGNNIAADRLSIFGMGESSPATTNDTDDGRQQNRRVEVKLVY
ncbi:MAG: OmpA family protein [Proteobacteria bacterium]|nr:OmpA family protein [Pseudomonadota bacterium]MBU1738417.1 OmpA family protein [Pseudomonadota bacterium]